MLCVVYGVLCVVCVYGMYVVCIVCVFEYVYMCVCVLAHFVALQFTSPYVVKYNLYLVRLKDMDLVAYFTQMLMEVFLEHLRLFKKAIKSEGTLEMYPSNF